MAGIIGAATAAIGGIVSATSSGSPSGQTTNTQQQGQQTGPPAWLDPYWQQIAGQAQTNFQGGGPQYYPGSTYAPPSDGQMHALAALQDRVNGGGYMAGTQNFMTGLEGGNYSNNPANAMLMPYASGSMLDAGNPQFTQMADTVKANVMPGLEAQFNGGNRMNSPGAAYAVTKGVGDAIGNLAYQNYNDSQNRQLAAAGQIGQNYNTGVTQRIQGAAVAPSVSQMDLGNLSAAYNAYATQQGLQQQGINADIARWNFGQNQPYGALSQYASLIGGIPGSQSTGQGSQSTPYYQNMGAPIMSAGLGLLGTDSGQDAMKAAGNWIFGA